MALADRPAIEQAALAYCAPRGIPLSVFLGRVVYPGDPDWTAGDAEAALDWLAAENRRCQCGHSLDETFGPGQYDKWNAEPSGTCDACRAISRATRIAAGHDDLDPTAGMRLRVWRDKEDD